MTSNPLLARFTSTPALVAAEMGDLFDACLTAAAAHPDMPAMLHGSQASNTDRDDGYTNNRAEGAWNDDGYWPAADAWDARYRPYVVRNGTLLIPVKGVLLHNFGYTVADWITGYEYIWRAFSRGMADGNVLRIALICDSPGGMVAGCFEVVDKMVAMRGTKPIAAFAAESAYSAAYAIASAADPGQLCVTKTGGVGSIGVVTMHVDYSQQMNRMGVAITYVFAGKHKVDGNPYEPLPDAVKARMQARIDQLYSVFVSSVARNRGLDEQAVRDTEALCFSGAEAVSTGLADKIGSLDDSLAAFAADLSTEGDDTMTDKSAADAAATTAAIDAARAEGMKAGELAANTRIKAILACDAAKERPKAALAAALNTSMSVDEASAFLAELAVEAPAAAAGGNAFNDAMESTGNPGLGGGGNTGGGADDPDAQANAIRELAGAAGIRGFAAPVAK